MKNINQLAQIDNRVHSLRTLAKFEAISPTPDAPQVKDDLSAATRELAMFLALHLPTTRLV